MDRATKRVVFLSAVTFLLLTMIGLMIFFANRAPAERTNDTGVRLLDKPAEAGSIYVQDRYAGEMQIPQYDIPLSEYAADGFQVSESGVISYENAALGLALKNNAEQQEVDWAQVKASGVDFVLLRVGFRYYQNGDIYSDAKFKENIEGALAAGLDVGVYFFSQAVTEQEAEEEADTVLTQIKDYQVKYPVLIKWNYAKAEDPNEVRTKDVTGEQMTGIVGAFCRKIKAEGYTAGFYADKTLGYEQLNLAQLSDYDIWYSEHRSAPAFYYDFQLWEYSPEATIPGIADPVEMCLALKSYGK